MIKSHKTVPTKGLGTIESARPNKAIFDYFKVGYVYEIIDSVGFDNVPWQTKGLYMFVIDVCDEKLPHDYESYVRVDALANGVFCTRLFSDHSMSWIPQHFRRIK